MLEDNGISMDDKGKALDNIYIERFWRTIKYQHIYLNPAKDGTELYAGIKNGSTDTITVTISVLMQNRRWPTHNSS